MQCNELEFFFFWMTGSTERMSLTPSDEAEGPCVRGGQCTYSNSSVFLFPSLPSSGSAAANHLPPRHSALCILLSHQLTSCPLSRHPWHRPLDHLPASPTASLRWCIHCLTSAHVQTISLTRVHNLLLSVSTCWSFTRTFAHNPLWEGKHIKQWNNTAQKWTVSRFRHRTRCLKDVRNRNRHTCWHCTTKKSKEPVCKLQNLVNHTAFICSALLSHWQRRCSDTLGVRQQPRIFVFLKETKQFEKKNILGQITLSDRP